SVSRECIDCTSSVSAYSPWHMNPVVADSRERVMRSKAMPISTSAPRSRGNQPCVGSFMLALIQRTMAPTPMAKAPTAMQADVIRSALALASRPSVDHLLYVGDLPLPEELFRGKPRARKRLVQAVVSESQRDVIEASGVPVLPLPDYDLGRPEKLKIALVSGIARGLYKEGDVVVGLLARKSASYPDSILVVTVGPEDEDGSFGFLQTEKVSAGVMDTLLELAVSVGVEGWEGRP